MICQRTVFRVCDGLRVVLTSLLGGGLVGPVLQGRLGKGTGLIADAKFGFVGRTAIPAVALDNGEGLFQVLAQAWMRGQSPIETAGGLLPNRDVRGELMGWLSHVFLLECPPTAKSPHCCPSLLLHPRGLTAMPVGGDSADVRHLHAWTLMFMAGSIVALFAEPQPPEPPPLERPKPPPAHVASSEGMPPLPYPVVPQKRQEKKNSPQPPVLLTKIRTDDPEDWTRTPNDIKGLLEWLSREMNVHFSSNIKTFQHVSTDVGQNPILYRSGYKPFKFTPDEARLLRTYLLGGGTIVFNALVGHPHFYNSALQAARELLPEQQVYRLRMDHPVFQSFYQIDKVKFRDRLLRDGVAADPYPHLDGVDLDNRTAIFISRWDFALGWEANPHESWGYADEDARQLGANIVAYVTAMRDAGRSVGKSVELINADKKTADKFRVGQIIHDGPWKARTAAFPMLLNQFHLATGTPVSFELRDVALTDPAIFEMPFLYLTGTTDFAFTETERANLRRFLANGGVLFAEAAEGRPSFDQAFRREIGLVLAGRQLRSIPAQHPLFVEPLRIISVKARQALAARRNNQLELPPELYGLEINGALAVIYSPYDLSAGWERASAPYALGIEPPDAISLGLNILFYALAH